MPRERRASVAVPGAGAVRAIATPAARPRWTCVYAPGAGSHIDDPFGVYLAATLPARGVTMLRFEFPYMAAGRRAPDRPAVLEATWRVMLTRASADGQVVAAGRSMGGRIASQVLASGARADALALFAYPLHPPGKPGQARDGHLASVPVPMLFCSGTRDTFASPDELRALVRRLPRRARLHLLEGADHGFSVQKSTGRTREDVWAEAAGAMMDWLTSLS
jgi:predicted alpha/beta-hydrolase family hydrolase